MKILLFITMLPLWLSDVLVALQIQDASYGIYMNFVFLFLFLITFSCALQKGVDVMMLKQIVLPSLFILIFSFFNRSYLMVLLLLGVAILYHHEGYMYFVKHYAWFYCGTVILVPFLLWGGITSNEVSFSIKRTEEINSWGFIHPNDYSIFAFHALCTLYILWYRKKIFFYLVSLPTMFFIMKSTGARTYTYSIFLLPLFELFPLKVRSWCSKHFYIIAAFYLSTSFLLLWFHDTKLDQILSTRLSCQYNALNLFPQNCYLLGMNNARYLTFLENATDTGIKLIVDSSAIRLFFTKGLFALVCVVFLYGKLASRYPDVFNKYFPLICVGLLSGLFEGRLFDGFFYYLLIISIPYLWLDKKDKSVALSERCNEIPNQKPESPPCPGV